ncbi:hypothetical protein [Streptomyces albidoflavus]|uniref:hypothetical protein n=1 Tax=Streptomyces albidoflavus TaxID=1886 RepID=UPI003450FB4A
MTTPPSSPRVALAHTLATFADEPDSGMAVVATRNQPVRGAVTGLTWGDLRALAAEATARPVRTERSRWQAVADALNAIDVLGIDLDGTITDHTAWSVVWDRDAERWMVSGYDAEAGESR